MPVARYYSSVAQPTTLTGGISGGAVFMTVAATTGFPSSFPYTLAVDAGAATEELVEVTAAAGPTLTVTRGVDGTSAQSHGAGAVVRHSTSARDFAEYQTHQAATADVHGVTGALVGASSTQTLANKTLTSPTVNSGALGGTFTGSPSFSGTPTFAGGVLNGTYTGNPTLSGNPSFTGAPVFNGTSAPSFQRAVNTDLALKALVAADAANRWQMTADGRQSWGDGTNTPDTNLYRSAPNVLKTDDSFVVNSSFTAGNYPGVWTAWTPAWTTTTGAHTPSYGNATVNASYTRLGTSLLFSVGILFGSSTNFGSGATGADNWSFGLPGVLAASAAFTGTQLICASGRAVFSATAVVPITARVLATGTEFILDVAGGRADGTAVSSSGALDAVTPWTWANGSQIQFSGALELSA